MNAKTNFTLEELVTYGIIPANSIPELQDMKRTEFVMSIHDHKIWQGSGKNQRWYTRVKEDGKPRRLIAKSTQKDLIDFLYDFYSCADRQKERTLKTIYDEWIEYKLSTVKRSNTVHRLDTDYRRFYLNEPLAETILNTPLLQLTSADIKLWACGIIKKHKLTQKAYSNAVTILRQVYDYLIENEIADRNPVTTVKIAPGLFRKTRKKKAETQIFYLDEIAEVLNACKRKARELEDVAFLVFPLLYHTGLRIGEVLALSPDDIDRENHVISVTKMLAVKDARKADGSWEKRQFEIVDFVKGGGDGREIVITDGCLHVLDDIRAMRKDAAGLFTGITESNVECKLYRLCDELGLTRRSPHKWRKTYISHLLNAGIDPDFVREQVGHKELKTTLNSYTYSTTKRTDQIKQLSEVLV